MEREKGILIAIEGLDGSGKATQSRLLLEHYEKAGRKVQGISFPDYQSDSSALIRMYLGGAFGKNPDDVNAYAASSFFAVDRYASFRTDWGKAYMSGALIIADRYTTSNAIHQCSKLPENQWEAYLSWLFHYEYDLLSLPSPDEVIYLRVDPEESQELMDTRYQGHQEKKDIHEANLSYLKMARKTADRISQRLNWTVVECMENSVKGKKMRSIQDIHEELVRILEKRELSRPLAQGIEKTKIANDLLILNMVV